MSRKSRDRAASRSSSTSRREPPARATSAPPAPQPAAPPAPPRPLVRDPWGLVVVAAVGTLIARAWGAPLGEPFAEDFDFLQRALFQKFTLLDGGGSTSFWRPIPHQLYYIAFGRLMLAHPGAVAAIHIALLALASLLLYRAFRTGRPGAWAAVVATAPVLSESTRTLIAWPSHFVDLSAWVFTALAAHETAKRRMPTALAALLGALLCKEIAVIAAPLLPLMPGIGPRNRGDRLRWLTAFGVATAAWAGVYLAVREHAHLAMPHHLEQAMRTASWGSRLGWSLANSLRAIMSLPLVQSTNDGAIGALLAIVALLWIAVGLRERRGRAHWGRALPWTAWGLTWFVLASATLTTVYPYWMPNRSAFGSLGLLAAAAELAWAAHPLMLGTLVGVRLVALGVAPAPPGRISSDAPQTGAFMDFEKAVRLQRLMRESRLALATRIPRATRGMRVGAHYVPRHADYAFGGYHAVRAWYRDPTLDWVPYARIRSHPDSSLAAVVEFEPEATPQVSIVEADAMRAYIKALGRVDAGDLDGADSLLHRAETLQLDDNARVFRGLVASEQARVLLGHARYEDAERLAARACELFHTNIVGNYVLACTAYYRGDLRAAAAHVDSTLKWNPTNPAALALRQTLREAARQRRAPGAATSGP